MEMNINKGPDQVQLPKDNTFPGCKLSDFILPGNIPKETVSRPEEAVLLSP